MQTQNVNDVIDRLAAKLSVPTAHLWSVLVSQVRVSAIQNAIWIAITLSGLVFFAKNRARLHAWAYDKEDGGFVILGAYIAATIAAFVLLVSSAAIIGQIMNPEYYALRSLLDALK